VLIQTGCGKTSVISLLERFYTPQSGHVISNGHDIDKEPLSSYRSNISLVAQEAALISGTIRENILLGIPSSPPSSCESCSNKVRGDLEARVHSACRAAGIHDFITSLPEGYETAVGAKGLALSGVCSPIRIYGHYSLLSQSICQPSYFMSNIRCYRARNSG